MYNNENSKDSNSNTNIMFGKTKLIESSNGYYSQIIDISSVSVPNKEPKIP